MRTCPVNKKPLDKAIFYEVEVDYCPECLGMWFEEDELRLAKDTKDRNLNWLDINLWKYIKKMKVSRGKKLCPTCRLPLYEVDYGDSSVKVDVCNICHGTWLDKKEFQAIIDYLKESENYEVLNNFSKKLSEEFWEIFIGPETLKEEVSDFLTVAKVLQYKFATKHPKITEIISNLPK
ncbi:zf-TFIIB domain-containing protein [Patescibacteria group bacterium]